MIVEVKEKNPISDYATVGIYFYTRGKDFVNAAIDMIIGQDKVNNEYYTAPTYNYLIKAEKRIGIYNIDKILMHGIGTPEDLENYIKNSHCRPSYRVLY